MGIDVIASKVEAMFEHVVRLTETQLVITLDDDTVVHMQLSEFGPDGPPPMQWAVPISGQPGVYEYFMAYTAEQALAQFKAKFQGSYAPGMPISLGVVTDE